MSPFLKMLMKVSAKMKDKLDYIIPYDKMQFIWVTDFFDLPTKGLCKLNNEFLRISNKRTDKAKIFYHYYEKKI